jgi:hypothetical protein
MLVGRVGFEPTRGTTPADFKSAASALPPPPHSLSKRLIASRYQPICPEATTGFEPVMAVLQTAAFPLGYVADLGRSGRWDSNPRLSPWQGDALPLSHARI